MKRFFSIKKSWLLLAGFFVSLLRSRFCYSVTILIISVALSQCRVVPLYGSLNQGEILEKNEAVPHRLADQDLKKRLARIQLAKPKDRFEQYLYKELAFLLYNGGLAESSNLSPLLTISGSYNVYYRSAVNIGEVTAYQGRPTLTQIIGYANYELKIPQSNDKVVLYQSQNFQSQISLYRSFSAYANKVEQDEAQRRLAQDLANIIFLNLLQYFSKK